MIEYTKRLFGISGRSKWTTKLIFSQNNHRMATILLYGSSKCDKLRHLTPSSTQKTLKTYPARTKTFEPFFFPYCAAAWGNLSEELRNINSINTYKSSILNLVRPKENSVFEVHDINGVKLLTRLRLDFRHLNKHKFRHNFNDIINPICSCVKEP